MARRWLQALVGLGVQQTRPTAASATSPGSKRRATAFGAGAPVRRGGPEEAALRALIYIRLPEGSIDERGFSVLEAHSCVPPGQQAAEPRTVQGDAVREQYLLVCIDAERAINALPTLLGSDVTARKAMLDALHRVLAARDTLSGEGKRRLAQVETLFDVRREPSSKSEPAHA